MNWLRWVVVVLALVESGWLAFDGGRALIVGDYITPGSGPHAGELGPWSKLVSAVGIEPRSTLMKSIHVLLGSVWLVAIAGYVAGLPYAWSAMVGCAALGLWYLPLGTVLGLLQLVLLLLPAVRNASG